MVRFGAFNAGVNVGALYRVAQLCVTVQATEAYAGVFNGFPLTARAESLKFGAFGNVVFLMAVVTYVW